MITVEQVRNNPQVRTYIQKADEALAALGYTEHSFAHVGKVAKEAREILLTLGYSPREAELAEIAAALILADKTDVRRSRVRNRDFATFDIHDRVNYAVHQSRTEITADHQKIILDLKIDTQISAVMDYFEIFMQRMLLCRKAAEKLGLTFSLVINDQIIL